MNGRVVEVLKSCWCCSWATCGGIGVAGVRVGLEERCMRCWAEEEAPEVADLMDGGGVFQDDPEPLETTP